MKGMKPCWRAFHKQELWMELGKGFFLCYMLAYLFYDCIPLVLFYGVLWYPWLWYEQAQKEKRIKKERLDELKEMLLSIHNSLYAGYSLENALKLASKDLKSCFGEKDGGLIEELEKIDAGLKMNIPVEELLKEMAQRVCFDEMNELVKVIFIVKKKGGNLVEILGQTIDHLNQKIQVKEEIITLTSAKVFEQKIMSIMPFLIIFYVRFTNPNYFDVLYESVAGWLISTVSIAVIFASYFFGNKLVEIEV